MKTTAQGEIRDRHFMSVISPGNLIIIRTPYPIPTPWRSAVVAPLTSIMTEQGLRAKDISSIEGLLPYPDRPEEWSQSDWSMAGKLDEAFSGNSSLFTRFWLYDWTPNGYVLVRAGS